MPSLRDLEAYFIRYEDRPARGKFVKPGLPLVKDGPWVDDDFEERDYIAHYMVHVETLAEAQGLMMGCPACYAKNGNSMVGTHWIDVTFAGRGVPDHRGSHGTGGAPTRWNVTGGTGLDDLVTSPSIQLLGGCNWHGFIGMAGAAPGHTITV